MERKKVVGFSFGRKMSNTEVMVKEVLLECKKAGMDIQFIRADDLNIHICTGCVGCVISLMTKTGSGVCIHKDDDFHIIDEALMSADAVVVGSPTYVLAPTGNFKVVCDRLGPSHDFSFCGPAIEAGKAEGRNPDTYPDERIMRKRVGVLLTVGGARTENWLSLAMPSMYEFTISMGIDVIDKYQYHGAMDQDHVLGRPDIMARMRLSGQHIVEALNADTEEERIRYRGDKQGICPVCHEDMLTIMHDGDKVECPVCGIKGRLVMVDGQFKAEFSPEEQNRSRLKDAGNWEHTNEIRSSVFSQRKTPNLQELKQRYIGVGE